MKHFCCEECPGDFTCEHHKVCMCGNPMEGHDDPWTGHSPVSMHEYYSRKKDKNEAYEQLPE